MKGGNVKTTRNAVLYVQRLRRPAKRAYAAAYLRFLDAPHLYAEPARPVGLSFMGAQEVRHQLAAAGAGDGLESGSA